MSLVIDGTVALAWCLDHESSGQADFVLSLLGATDVRVPAHWEVEVVNGLTAAERLGQVEAGDPERLLRLISGLPIKVEPAPGDESTRLIRRFARQHQLNAFDAAYLELAVRTDSQLITLDRTLADAAREEGAGG